MPYPFFSMVDYYFVVPAVIAQIFNPSAELVIPIGTLTNEANTKIVIQPATAETKIRKSSNWFRAHAPFYAFHALSQYVLCLLKDIFVISLFLV